jgi:hypothetical protein
MSCSNSVSSSWFIAVAPVVKTSVTSTSVTTAGSGGSAAAPSRARVIFAYGSRIIYMFEAPHMHGSRYHVNRQSRQTLRCARVIARGSPDAVIPCSHACETGGRAHHRQKKIGGHCWPPIDSILSKLTNDQRAARYASRDRASHENVRPVLQIAT